MKPKRIQRRRIKGWRMPRGARYVGRPGPWGNPFKAEAPEARGNVVRTFRTWLTQPGVLVEVDHLEPKRQRILDHIHELRGKDLACWCPLNQPCHADVLIELANNMGNFIDETLELKEKHRKTWRDKSEGYWLMRLWQEVCELTLALVGKHEHTPEWELAQIASICLNWLEYRVEKVENGE